MQRSVVHSGHSLPTLRRVVSNASRGKRTQTRRAQIPTCRAGVHLTFSSLQSAYSPLAARISCRRFATTAAPVSQRPPILILFGSQTGNATLLGDQLTKQARDKGWEADLVDLHDFNHAEDLSKRPLVILIMSCFGRGEPTDNARDFYNWIVKADPASTKIKGVNFAVFGLGSTAYSSDRYQAVGRLIDRRMEELGAHRVCPRGEGDDAHSIEDDFDEWTPKLWESLEREYPELKVEEAVPEDSGREPHMTWIDVKTVRPAAPTVYKTVDDTVIDIRNPHLSPILAADQLHSSLSDRSVKHLTFGFSEVKDKKGATYESGDYLGVYPENPDHLVEELAHYLNLDLDAKFELTSTGLKEVATKLPFFFPRPCSIRDAIKYYCDLTKPPRRALMNAMMQHASGSDLDRLQALLNGPKEDFEKALNYKTLVQILKMFPSVQINFEELLELTPALQPRFYSISSSPLLQPDSIDLTVVRHRFFSAFDRSVSMFGLCSNFLNSVKLNDRVRVFVRNTLFKLPTDPTIPVIMIGAGTGFAPFRGFIQEREALRAKFPNLKHGKNLMIFGCMDRKKDFIYGNDLLDWANRGVIDLITAFSHEQPELIFVQRRVKEHAALMWDLIGHQKAHIYICGGKPMGDAVHEQIIQLVASEGKMTRAESEAFLKAMSDDHKYQSDVFE